MENENKNPRKVVYILLSVLVAVAFWIYVDEFGHNGTARIIEHEVTEIPIEYIKEETLAERGLMLLEEDTSETVDLTLEGKRRLVTELDRSKIRITADLSTITEPGKQSVILTTDYRNQDGRYSDIRTVRRSLSRALVNIVELYTREVEVRCELVGNVADGYSAGQMQLSHQTVQIRGQAEDIDPVSYAKVTLNIGKDAKNSISEALTCQFYDKNNRLLDSTGIKPVEETVQVTLPVYVTKELKLAVGFKESPGVSSDNLDFTISPGSIIVSGEAGKLQDVEMIMLGEFDLLDLLGSDSATHSYPIIIPDGCQNLSGVTRATLEVSFKDMKTARVETSQFQYLDPPEGKTVTILTETLPIRIFGTSADVDAVTGEDITVMLNLGEYSGASGNYTVPAAIDMISSGNVGVSGTYEVQINISEDVPEADDSTQP